MTALQDPIAKAHREALLASQGEQTYLVEIGYADIMALRDAVDLAVSYILLRRTLDRAFGKEVSKRPGPLRRRLTALQKDWPSFTRYDPDPCFGIHNFVTDEGGDPVTGPAHCTECGAERIDPR